MSEFGTSEVVKHLSKAAHMEENKGHFEQAENLYRSIVTLEEMAQFPADTIKQAKEDLLQCEMNGANAAMRKAMESQPNLPTILSPKTSNDNGIFRPKKQAAHANEGESGRVEMNLDASSSINKKIHTSPLSEKPEPCFSKTGSTRLIDLEKEWQEKTNGHIIIFTDAPEIYPSKGCP